MCETFVREPLHLGIVGPLPPPAGGMATQTRQLVNLLEKESVEVSLVQNNRPYRPGWVANLKGVRALFRLIPYLVNVWKLAGNVDVIHLMANSGWSWQLFSAPVLWIGWLRKTPVIVNYRGGEANVYFEKSFQWVKPSLIKAKGVVVPSGYLEKVFADYGVTTKVIPNIINLDRFTPAHKDETSGQEQQSHSQPSFTLIITRNLEAIYGIETAIKAVALARQKVPNIHLHIAGTGPLESQLKQLTEQLDLQDVVTFVGRLDAEQIVAFYQSADVMLNPTTVDNMPNSVLEALASGVPVITTNVGGIPYIVEHEKTALMVSVGHEEDMADAIVRLYQAPETRKQLIKNGISAVQPYAWPHVKGQWLSLYHSVRAEI
jgi:glycosyltransferase involved in cell wall biosynthesis